MQGVIPINPGQGVDRNDEPPRTLTIYIDPPVEDNGKSYTELRLEEPTARMIERAEAELAGNMSVHSLRKYQIALVSQGAQVPRSVVDKMRISQVREAADFLATFIGGGPETGAT
jgi:hypothetical protein